MRRQNIIHKGNDSLAISALWGAGSLVSTCPLCILASGAFLVNAVKEKLVD